MSYIRALFIIYQGREDEQRLLYKKQLEETPPIRSKSRLRFRSKSNLLLIPMAGNNRIT